MLETILPWRRDGRRIAFGLVTLAGVAWAAGCDDAKYDTRVQPRAGSGGGGAGGSMGGTGGTAGSAVGGGGAGTGGTQTEDRDAGADAASSESDCVVGTL